MKLLVGFINQTVNPLGLDISTYSIELLDVNSKQFIR